MSNLTLQFIELKSNLESVAFLISKGGSEKEALTEVVQSLVLLAQIETEVNDLENIDTSRSDYSRVNKINAEVKKVKRRTPRWFINKSQYNSIILISFLQLSEQHSEVSPFMLRNKCKLLKGFKSNYDQMKNFGKQNHGKVFEEIDGIINLWKPVKAYILNLHNQHKNA